MNRSLPQLDQSANKSQQQKYEAVNRKALLPLQVSA